MPFICLSTVTRYLANDMQFFLTSPIIIFALWKRRTIGLTLLTTLLVYLLVNRYVYRVSQKKILSELLDLALIMDACLNPAVELP